MSKPISQREARRLQKRVIELEAQRRTMFNRWDTPHSGTHILGVDLTDTAGIACRTARRLGFVLMARIGESNRLDLYALREPRS